jgi:phage gpG-like protein
MNEKLDFIHKMTKLALDSMEEQHFQQGGTVLSGPTQPAQGGRNPSGGLAGPVANFLGTSNKFQAQAPALQQGTNVGQLNQAYQNAQQGIAGVGNLAGTLSPGVGQGAKTQDVLTQQLLGQAQGQGPSVGQEILNQATRRNIAQQAALQAGQRGAGANAGLIAANNANLGANIQQQAGEQAALLGAQQQLAAQGQLAGLAGQQVGQGLNAAQLQGQLSQNEQNILQNANAAANQAAVASQNNINEINAKAEQANQQANQGILAGLGQALGGIGGALLGPLGTEAGSALGNAAKNLFGGKKKEAFGGEILPPHLDKMMAMYHPHFHAGGMVHGAPQQTKKELKGEKSMMGYKMGGMVKKKHMMHEHEDEYASGVRVPGEPKVHHDDYKNDTVEAKLSPGEFVIDIDSMKDKGKLGKMARFVAKEIERKKMGRKLV